MVKRSTKSGVDKAKKPAKAKAAIAPAPPEKPPTTQAEIDRIGDIIKNARGTWFGLLGALVFAAITLASVKDASFFIASEQTKLPLLGISVPITSFFWAGALLITALYTYLHLYLVQLWDALGDADPQFDGKPLADVIHPWLVSDAALRMRDSLRKAKDNEHCSRQRGMSMVSTLVSILLVWFFGLITIGWFWWRSMPAHDIWLTGWLCILLIWSLRVFWCSRTYALMRLGEITTDKSPPVWLLIFLFMIVSLTVLRTHIDILEGESREEIAFYESDCLAQLFDEYWDDDICSNPIAPLLEPIRPARAEMAETVFTQKPSSWKGYELAKQEFRKSWCKQIGKDECKLNPLEEDVKFSEHKEFLFEKAWERQSRATFSSFTKPNLMDKRLEGANLNFTELEGVNLMNSKLRGAYLMEAKMQHAVLINTDMRGAFLYLSDLQEASLTSSLLRDAELSFANLLRADLSNAEIQNAYLTDTNMRKTDLSAAKLHNADLTGARMIEAELVRTEMQGAILFRAWLHGTVKYMMILVDTDLSQTDFYGASLRYIDFSESIGIELQNFDKSFGDGSVKLAEGMKRPKDWCYQILSNAQYWGRYKGWFKKNAIGETWDEDVPDYPLIPFSTPCPEDYAP